MFVIPQKQMRKMEELKRDEFASRLLKNFRTRNTEFLPEKDDEAVAYISKRIKESKEWGLENDSLVEKYVYLCLSYKKMNEKQLPPEYVSILTWPERSSEDKLTYLHDKLIQDHYVTNAR